MVLRAEAVTALATRTSRPSSGRAPSWRSGARRRRGLGGGGVRLGLVDQVQAGRELAGLEAAGPGQQRPGGGEVVLDQQGLVPGVPGEHGSTAHDQAEQQRDQQTSKHDEPPLPRSAPTSRTLPGMGARRGPQGLGR